MKLRKFNDLGIKRFTEYLDSLTLESSTLHPDSLLIDPELSIEISPVIEIEKSDFSSRFEAAGYLYGQFKKADMANFESDRGLWAWLSLCYFKTLCPVDSKGRLRPGSLARWIPEGGARRYYRHLLAGPYHIYSAHVDNPERVMIVLCGPLHAPGDIAEQLASRQEIITNQELMQAITALYYDVARRRPRRGAANKTGPGTLRRFIDMLNQFDVTWDLYSLRASDIINMLPDEFSKFMPGR